jgi:hypothetical protein
MTSQNVWNLSLLTFLMVWAFIWKLGSGSASGWKVGSGSVSASNKNSDPNAPDPHQKIRIRIRIRVISRIQIHIRRTTTLSDKYETVWFKNIGCLQMYKWLREGGGYGGSRFLLPPWQQVFWEQTFMQIMFCRNSIARFIWDYIRSQGCKVLFLLLLLPFILLFQFLLVLLYWCYHYSTVFVATTIVAADKIKRMNNRWLLVLSHRETTNHLTVLKLLYKKMYIYLQRLLHNS